MRQSPVPAEPPSILNKAPTDENISTQRCLVLSRMSQKARIFLLIVKCLASIEQGPRRFSSFLLLNRGPCDLLILLWLPLSLISEFFGHLPTYRTGIHPCLCK